MNDLEWALDRINDLEREMREVQSRLDDLEGSDTANDNNENTTTAPPEAKI